MDTNIIGILLEKGFCINCIKLLEENINEIESLDASELSLLLCNNCNKILKKYSK